MTVIPTSVLEAVDVDSTVFITFLLGQEPAANGHIMMARLNRRKPAE